MGSWSDTDHLLIITNGMLILLGMVDAFKGWDTTRKLIKLVAYVTHTLSKNGKGSESSVGKHEEGKVNGEQHAP